MMGTWCMMRVAQKREEFSDWRGFIDNDVLSRPSLFIPSTPIGLYSFSFILEDGHMMWIPALLSLLNGLLNVAASSLTLPLPVHRSSYVLASVDHLLEGVLTFPLNCSGPLTPPVVNTRGSEPAVWTS